MNKKIKIFMIIFAALLTWVVVALLCSNLPSGVAEVMSFILGMPIGSLAVCSIMDITN